MNNGKLLLGTYSREFSKYSQEYLRAVGVLIMPNTFVWNVTILTLVCQFVNVYFHRRAFILNSARV